MSEISDGDLFAVGGELDAPFLFAAYRRGLFPMGLGEGGEPPYGWFAPAARGIIELESLRIAPSLARSARGTECRIDTSFAEVVSRCADPDRPSGWITDDIRGAYEDLHDLGLAHSVETWRRGELVGGLYGVAYRGLFAGESMFHESGASGRDASKIALMGLVDLLSCAPNAEDRLLDVQWSTPHLASLGAIEVPPDEYSARLERALALEPAFAREPRRSEVLSDLVDSGDRAWSVALDHENP